jgi:hypothetical protein
MTLRIIMYGTGGRNAWNRVIYMAKVPVSTPRSDLSGEIELSTSRSPELKLRNYYELQEPTESSERKS